MSSNCDAELDFGRCHLDVSVLTMYVPLIVVHIRVQLTIVSSNHISEFRRIDNIQEWFKDRTTWNSELQWNR